VKELVCVGCPLGCRLQVETRDQTVTAVRGQQCARGKAYAEDEVLRPRRMITALVAIPGSHIPLSVRTRAAIPKDLILSCLREIRALKVTLPVQIGDVLLPDILGTGVDLIATRDLPEKPVGDD
jgi:CxxC motif-containing protein